MKLYKNYCYEDLSTVALNIESEVINDFGIIQSATVSGSDINISYSNGQKNFTVLVTPPDCSELGFNSTFTGISTLDAVDLSGLVLLVLASAFSVKVLKRGL